MDIDNLGPGPDLAAVDFSKLDMGNNLPDEAPVVSPEPADEAPVEDVVEETAAAEETSEKDEEAEEEKATEAEKKEDPPRDETGKFAKKDKSDTRVPKSRFDEAVAKEREAKEQAEKRAEELERQLYNRQQQSRVSEERAEKVKALDAQVDELTKQHTKHLLDGEADKAAELMKEIRQQERTIARMEAQDEARQIADQTIEADRINLSIAKLESEHPVLNPKSEQYDDDLVQTILLWQGKSMEAGLPPSQALQAAAEKVLGKFYGAQDKADAPAEEKKGLSTQKVAEDRKKEAVTKAVATQKAQPASTASIGVDSDKAGEGGLPDPTKMSMEEFAALPETTRARLRGDVL